MDEPKVYHFDAELVLMCPVHHREFCRLQMLSGEVGVSIAFPRKEDTQRAGENRAFVNGDGYLRVDCGIHEVGRLYGFLQGQLSKLANDPTAGDVTHVLEDFGPRS